MREYTARCAARDTRRAIAKVEKAMAGLMDCTRHWDDLDYAMGSTIARIAPIPESVASLKSDLDEVYPALRNRGGRHA